METFVILARLPVRSILAPQPGDGGGSKPKQRSPIDVVEGAIDYNGGTVRDIGFLEGRFDLFVKCEMPNHEATLKVDLTLREQGYTTETSVWIDKGTVEHAWEAVQSQTAGTARR